MFSHIIFSIATYSVLISKKKKIMIATYYFLLSNLFSFKSILFDRIIKEQNSLHRSVQAHMNELI